MSHECEKTPDSVEVYKSSLLNKWKLRSEVARYADSNRDDYYVVRHEMFIEYCPFCGKKLFTEDSD